MTATTNKTQSDFVWLFQYEGHEHCLTQTQEVIAAFSHQLFSFSSLILENRRNDSAYFTPPVGPERMQKPAVFTEYPQHRHIVANIMYSTKGDPARNINLLSIFVLFIKQ